MAAAIDMPRSAVARVIKNALPPASNHPGEQFKVSVDVKAALARAGGLFTLYLVNAADERCKASGRSTVIAEDILGGLEETELDMLIQPTLDYVKAYRRKQRGGGGGGVDGGDDDGGDLTIRPTKAGGGGKDSKKSKSGSSKSKSSSSSNKKRKSTDSGKDKKRVKGSVDLTGEGGETSTGGHEPAVGE